MKRKSMLVAGCIALLATTVFASHNHRWKEIQFAQGAIQEFDGREWNLHFSDTQWHYYFAHLSDGTYYRVQSRQEFIALKPNLAMRGLSVLSWRGVKLTKKNHP